MLGMKGSVTRNDTIARVCHDTKLAETKGSGIDRMWRKMVDAGLSRPTMESDRTAATFTIRLLLCHFFSEEMLDWLKRFAAYELNDNQRTALVFLREVGAIDAVAYRQLTGCSPKLVAKELSGIKDQGLMVQKGRARGTYYVPAEILLEDIKNEKEGLISQPQGLISQVSAVTTTPQGVTGTPQAVTGTPRAVTGTPRAVTGTPRAVTGTPLPEELSNELEKLKRRTSPQKMKDLILRLCKEHPMSRDDLIFYLKRGRTTIDNYLSLMIGKELFSAGKPYFRLDKSTVRRYNYILPRQIPRLAVGIRAAEKILTCYAVKLFRRVYQSAALSLEKLINADVIGGIYRITHDLRKPCSVPMLTSAVGVYSPCRKFSKNIS